MAISCWIAPLLIAVTSVRPGVDVRANCDAASEQAETALRIDPFDADHLVAAAIDWSTGAQTIGWYTSFDAGASWSCGQLGLESGYVAAGDPVVCFDVRGGVHLFSIQVFGPAGNAISAHHSNDGGLTFPTSTLVDVDPGNDKPIAVLDLSAGSDYGRIALTLFRLSFSTGTGGRIFVTTSTDDGQTWSTPVRINEKNANGNLAGWFCDLAFGPNGELDAAWIDHELQQVMFDRSLDGGATWGSDQLVADFTNPPNPLPGFQFDLKPVFAIAEDMNAGPYGGNLYVAYHHWDTSGAASHADVLCATSSDGGATWSSVVVRPGDTLPTDQFYPDVAVDRLGGVEVAWLDRRAKSDGSQLELWGSRSLDGGATFVETRIADAPFDPYSGGFGGLFIGHYNALDAATSHAVAGWADSRAGADDLDVWVDLWRVDLATDVSVLHSSTGGAANVSITPGPALGGAEYLLLGSATGTDPGFDLGRVHVPLTWDEFTTATVVAANSAGLQNTLGVLAPDGSAKATLDSLGPFDPGLAGLELRFAAVFFDSASGKCVHATAPISIALEL